MVYSNGGGIVKHPFLIFIPVILLRHLTFMTAQTAHTAHLRGLPPLSCQGRHGLRSRSRPHQRSTPIHRPRLLPPCQRRHIRRMQNRRQCGRRRGGLRGGVCGVAVENIIISVVAVVYRRPVNVNVRTKNSVKKTMKYEVNTVAEKASQYWLQSWMLLSISWHRR